MIKIFKISAIVLVSVLFCTSCLNSNDSESISYNLSNPTVTAFSFSSNSNVCDNLSSYKFSIDNYGVTDTELIDKCENLWRVNEWTEKPGIIFNPDSLPRLTEPDSITVSISYNSPSKVLFYQYNKDLELQNITDFSDTTVIYFDDYAYTRLEVTAYDGYTNKSYFVKVNVHKVYGDTVVWKYFNKEIFDTELVAEQRVDTIGSTLYWYTEMQDGTQLVRTADLDGDINNWSSPEELTGNLKLGSLINHCDGSIYATSKSGSLLKSTDGKNWSEMSNTFTFHNLLGVQLGVELNGKKYSDEKILAIVKQGDEYHFASSLDGSSWELANLYEGNSLLPDNFPIDGYTLPISVAAQPTAGNITSRIYIVAGTDKNGNLLNSTWSCDGSTWTEFTQNIFIPMKGASIVRYTRDTDYPNTLWILHPGVMENGEVSRKLWFSENSGVTWKLLEREYPDMSQTKKITPIACNSAFSSNKNYKIYFFGGIDANSKQQSSIYGGAYNKNNFSKTR